MWTRRTFAWNVGVVASCANTIAQARAAVRLSSASARRIDIPLSFDPDLTIREVLLLPDRNQPLQAVDPFKRRIECRTPVRSRGDDHHARFADLHCAQAVHHGDAADGEFTGNQPADFRHFADRHSFVAFIIQTKSLATSGIVTDYAL